MRLISEPDGDPVPVERPQLLDKAVLQLSGPLPCEKREDLFSTPEKFRAIAPVTMLCIATGNLLWITCVPFILDSADLQNRRFSGEWWYEAHDRLHLCIHDNPPFVHTRNRFLNPFRPRHDSSILGRPCFDNVRHSREQAHHEIQGFFATTEVRTRDNPFVVVKYEPRVDGPDRLSPAGVYLLK
jgi:hypothetical protein